MASKKSYSRYFIILQEDEKGYALEREKNSSGYVKLEKKNNKCKVSFYAQNINPDMEPYYMVLVCRQKEKDKLIVIGKLPTDEQGKIDVNNEYDLENIGNSKISMENIKGACIAKVIDNNIISLMSGFTNNSVPKDWKGYEVIKTYEEKSEREKELKDEHSVKEDKNAKTSSKKEEPKREEVKEEVGEEVFKEYEEKIQTKTECNEDIPLRDDDGKQNEEINKNDDVEEMGECREGQNESNEEKDEVREEENKDNVKESKDDEKENRGNEKEELEHITHNKIEEEEYLRQFMECDSPLNSEGDLEFCTLEENMRKKKKHKNEEDYCCLKDYPIGRLGAYFKSITCGFEEMNNMGDEIPYCRWYKIPVSNLEDMYDNSDYHRYTVIYYPMICYYSYICRYEHFCLGYKCNKDGKLMYIIYAIPGKKDEEYQPYRGRTGFVTWIPCKDKRDYGYWIMFYDFRKSTVVIPIKKS